MPNFGGRIRHLDGGLIKQEVFFQGHRENQIKVNHSVQQDLGRIAGVLFRTTGERMSLGMGSPAPTASLPTDSDSDSEDEDL